MRECEKTVYWFDRCIVVLNFYLEIKNCTKAKPIIATTKEPLQHHHRLLDIKYLKAVIGAYDTCGCHVTIVLANNNSKVMKRDFANLCAILHITSRDEHAPKVERYNHTIKECVRGNHAMLPFQHLPPVFIIEMVYSSVFWRNMFAWKGGESKTQSPLPKLSSTASSIITHIAR